MRVSPTAGAAVFLLIAIWPARSQEIPDLNVDPVCRGIAKQAANPTEKGDPDLSFANCVKSEQAMRQRLVGEWAGRAADLYPGGLLLRSRSGGRGGQTGTQGP
jgi:hypothetical protein